MTYEIPGIPPSMNKYKGRQTAWEYRKDKEHWEALVARCCRPKPEKPIPRCVLTLTHVFPDKRRRDPNNYDGQFITDGLVKAGIIEDDSFRVIDLVLKADYDKNNPKVVIEIDPIVSTETVQSCEKT